MKLVAANRRAKFDFELSDTIEAGMILTGQEVKACRAGQVTIAGSYVSFLGGKPLLKQAKIAPYKHASGLDGYEPARDRHLLLSKSQIAKLQTASNEKGISIVPLEVRAGKFIKVMLGIGRGRKRIDKRERIKEKEMGRRLRMGKEV